MKQFNILEIAKNIEEVRLVLGEKVDDFLLKKLSGVGDFFSRIFSAKSCALLGSLLIIAISIFVRSTRDIGQDSALYVEIAQKMLSGGKYFQDFFENNLPLAFYFTIIPVFLAKVFAINPMIALEIFSNLVGISAIYCSARILMRSDVSKDQTVFNLIILSLAAGFFLRVYTLQFNEFGTKSTYFVAFAIIYVSYQFLKEFELKRSDQVCLGILSALFFCLKPHYGILPIFFELKKIYEKKSLKSAFCLRNYVTLLLLIFYLLFLFAVFPDFIAAVPIFSVGYYNAKFFHMFVICVGAMLKEEVFPSFALMVLCLSLIKKYNFLRPFFFASIALSLTIISELIAGYDQRFVFYSLFSPLVVLLIFLMFKDRLINWKRDGIILLMILIIPQFDHSFFTKIIFNFCVFWWIFVLVLSKTWRKILAEKKLIHRSFLGYIFLPQNWLSWLCFSFLTLLTIFLSFDKKLNDLVWVFSGIIFILLLGFYQNLHTKIISEKKFSFLSSCVIFIATSYFVSLYQTTIFNIHEYQSPNYVSDQMISIIRNHTTEDENIAVVASSIFGTYPVMNFVKKENPLPSSQLVLLNLKIDDHDEMSSVQKYLLFRFKQQLRNPKNKLVFIEIATYPKDNHSRIRFLEYYYLHDPEFKKIFLENYVFLNRILSTKPTEKTVQFFGDGQQKEISTSQNWMARDVEVYIRKDSK